MERIEEGEVMSSTPKTIKIEAELVHETDAAFLLKSLVEEYEHDIYEFPYWLAAKHGLD